MRNVWIIARREYKHYFTSPIAYVVAFIFVFIIGWSFSSGIIQAITYLAYGQSYVPGVEIVIGLYMILLLLFSMPAITMRSVAEELKMGTMELLLTAPVKDWELIVGKWLGALLFMLTLLAVTLVFPLVLNLLVKPGIDQGTVLTGYLGLILMTASLLAIGVFISSLTNNQVIAFIINFAIVLVLWFVLQPLGSDTSSSGSQILSYMNFINHYLSFFRGTIDLSDIVYYLSLTSLGLFLGTVSIEVRRWR